MTSVQDETDMINEILLRVSHPNFSVDLDHNADCGYLMWAIVDHSDPGFWITAFKTYDEAIDFCAKCAWYIENVSQDRTQYYIEMGGIAGV